MKFDSSLVPPKLGPRKKRETQIDRGGIESINRVFEFQSDVLVAVKATGFGNKHLSKVGIDAPIAGLVGVGQIVARDSAPDSHIIEPVLDGFQTRDDIAEAFPIGQLGKGQTEELIETRKFSNAVIAAITPDAFSKFVKRKESHNLREDGRLNVHRKLLEGKKSPDYTKLRSNRLRRKKASSSLLCARRKDFIFP